MIANLRYLYITTASYYYLKILEYSCFDLQRLTGPVLCYVQCESKNPTEIFRLFPNGWEFLVQILHTYYTFLSTLDYKFLFNYQ